MEQQLRAACEKILNQATTASNAAADTLQALAVARSLIINPSTSEATISSLFETLSRSLQPERDPLSLHHTLSILSDLAARRPHLSHPIFHAVRSFSLLSNHSSTRTLAAALSVLASIAESDQTLTSVLNELGEGLFLNLCFRPSVSVRQWLLLNAERFRVRPHLLLTVFLGFTKDPYPYVRRVAMDGLVGLCKSAVVEDRSLTESCYCRAFELLTDMEDSVRAAAVRSVSYQSIGLQFCALFSSVISCKYSFPILLVNSHCVEPKDLNFEEITKLVVNRENVICILPQPY